VEGRSADRPRPRRYGSRWERQRRLGDHLGVEVFGDLALLLHLLGARRDVEQRHAAVGADHVEGAVLVFDVAFAGFERGGGDLLALGEHRFERFHHGMAAVMAVREPTEA
jgi:hypothetical protein